jgi:diguanylate cyclase (GGDEF)-like protein
MLAGLLLLLRSRMQGVPITLRADGLTAALAIAAVSAAIVFDTALGAASGDPLGVATTLAYPITDLILGGFIVGALAGTGWRLDRTWTLLGVGILTFWLADSLYLVQVAEGNYESSSWFDAGWWIGLTLIGAAAWQPRPEHEAQAEGLRLIVMPLSFATVGLGLLIYGSFAPLNPLAVVLAAAALVAVMGRLILTFRDNVRMLEHSRDEATTDALTGLCNRRALTRDLERMLPRARDGHTVVLALFDLDGFKGYNDTFGHPAGDALLARMGRNLGAYLEGRGTAYRMGGDEFCALFEPGDQVVEPIVACASAALSEHGEGFSITSSHGSIVMPLETVDAAEALRIADRRMYAQKHAGRASASRQSKDVLVRALAERNPDLSSHSHDTAGLAADVARNLALTDEGVDSVRHAAELRDVGKVAIPDEILAKPGPLEPREQTFVRNHTLIGERIISAAPALTEVARIVRSSHERWDGTGYPDGLAGGAIPLGSRIVFVADAFDAMTSDRPYRKALTPDQALRELRDCAGTQFDPVVVEAFSAAWAQRDTPVTAS